MTRIEKKVDKKHAKQIISKCYAYDVTSMMHNEFVLLGSKINAIYQEKTGMIVLTSDFLNQNQIESFIK